MAFAESIDASAGVRPDYLEMLQRVERLHRQLLDVVKDELDRTGITDLTSVQALLIFNIGDTVLTAGELRTRGHYLGSNVSYNLKKLVDLGYIAQERSEDDRRTVQISLTEAGLAVRDRLEHLFARQSEALEPSGGLTEEHMAATNTALTRIERFWTDHIRFRL
ncbi:MarR family winged helix-turn-helix transcriptional regulator [Hyphobacterium marinum]|uniref:MarR family transcriptional regulator n=1 Tax=Hyphobacterium marinum TaxID=3116574 RepID=A0ABU7LYP2_9PROT|nr:MarR family transcriptional regulator [Hyphobacterium sp. Y6023]MEE2566681.1 MarR family transcriptional regulator [Hyphobacterium sp. Y6023]